MGKGENTVWGSSLLMISGSGSQGLETEENRRKLVRKGVPAERVGVKLTCSNLDGTKD